jgi:hypothetical protein
MGGGIDRGCLGCIGRGGKVNPSIFIIPAVFFVAMVAIFGIRKAPGIFLGILAACAVIYCAAAILHA